MKVGGVSDSTLDKRSDRGVSVVDEAAFHDARTHCAFTTLVTDSAYMNYDRGHLCVRDEQCH